MLGVGLWVGRLHVLSVCVYCILTTDCMDQSGFFDLNFNLTSEKVLCVHDYVYNCVLVGCRLPMVTTTTVKTTIPVSDFRPLNGLID